MQEDPNYLNGKGSIKLSLQAYIKILPAKLVSILILPPFMLYAINFTPKKLVFSPYFPIREEVCFFLNLDLFRILLFDYLSLRLF